MYTENDFRQYCEIIIRFGNLFNLSKTKYNEETAWQIIQDGLLLMQIRVMYDLHNKDAACYSVWKKLKAKLSTYGLSFEDIPTIVNNVKRTFLFKGKIMEMPDKWIQLSPKAQDSFKLLRSCSRNGNALPPGKLLEIAINWTLHSLQAIQGGREIRSVSEDLFSSKMSDLDELK